MFPAVLAAVQKERKAKQNHDAGRIESVFKVGCRVLLRAKEPLDTENMGKQRPR